MIHLDKINLTIKDKSLFKDYDLKISSNEKILLNSSSGSGKTSLFKMLLGFQQPDSGEIYVNDQLLTDKNLLNVRRNFAYLSQDVDLPNSNFNSVLEQFYNYEMNSHLVRNNEHILELFDRFRLTTDFFEKDIAEISGGERQRLGLIICLLLERPVLLLDEPTSALDSEIRDIVVELFISLEKTVLVISHDKQWAGKMRAERW